MESKEYFEVNATQWEKMRQGFFSEEVCEAALDAAGVRAGETAVDVGAGSGFLSRGLVARGLSVIAVDQSQAMLDELSAHLPGVDCRLGESQDLPVEDASVDHAIANMYLHHVPDPAAAIAEMARVLKPGGRLVLIDLDEHEHEFLRTEHHDRWMGFKRTGVERWISQAGLKQIRVGGAGSDCCANSCASDDKARISIFLAQAMKPRRDA